MVSRSVSGWVAADWAAAGGRGDHQPRAHRGACHHGHGQAANTETCLIDLIFPIILKLREGFEKVVSLEVESLLN